MYMVDIIHVYVISIRSLRAFTRQRITDVLTTFSQSLARGTGSFLFLCLILLRSHISLFFPSAIDVTYLLEEGAGRRLRRRTLGFGDFVGRK